MTTETKKFLPRKPFAIWFGDLVRGKPYSEITLIKWEKDGREPRPIRRVGRDVIYSTEAAEQFLLAGAAQGETSPKVPDLRPTSQKASRPLSPAPRQRRDGRKPKFASSA